MSIDLSRVTGISDSRGVITEIKDSLGRVIWAAVKGSIGTLYLRPSADISLGHPVYPTTLSAGYLAINEEVSDGASTYIGYASSSTGEVSSTSRFSLSPDIKDNVSHVSSAKLYLIGSVTGNTQENAGQTTGYCSGSVSVSGETVFTWDKSATSGVNVLSTVGTEMPDFVTFLNNYLAASGNKNIPDVVVEITNRVRHSNKTATSYVTQVAIELECG